jgi:hypothetical protein
MLGVAIGFLPTDAWAYIDPGHGALVLQAVLSGFFGAIFLARHALRRMIARFRAAIGWGPQSPTTGTPPDA